MRFLPSLTEFLREHDRIYTLRRPLYGVSYSTTVEDVGDCTVSFVRQIMRAEDLTPYVEFSGFTNVFSWWSKAHDLSGAGRKYLYEVKVK
jgi:hypothetical protein